MAKRDSDRQGGGSPNYLDLGPEKVGLGPLKHWASHVGERTGIIGPGLGPGLGPRKVGPRLGPELENIAGPWQKLLDLDLDLRFLDLGVDLGQCGRPQPGLLTSGLARLSWGTATAIPVLGGLLISERLAWRGSALEMPSKFCPWRLFGTPADSQNDLRFCLLH